MLAHWLPVKGNQYPGLHSAVTNSTTAPATPGVIAVGSVWDYSDPISYTLAETGDTTHNSIQITFDLNVNIASHAIQLDSATTGEILPSSDILLVTPATTWNPGHERFVPGCVHWAIL
jgi:hypothetical protein